MASPYLSEIKIVGFTFPPRGWALCDGQILPINQYQSLYSLLGTTYGGDGRTTFGLPEMRGRTAIHAGSTIQRGQKAGVENVFLTTPQIPSHDHTLHGTSDNASGGVAGAVALNQAMARATTPVYHSAANLTPLKTTNTPAVGNTGGNQSHTNMQPWLALNFCIALQGTFPSRN